MLDRRLAKPASVNADQLAIHALGYSRHVVGRFTAPLGSIRDHGPDAVRQHRHVEWIRHDLHTGIKMPVTEDRVLSVAGHEHHLQVGPEFARRVGWSAP